MSMQTFVDVPHNSCVVDRARQHKVSILCPANIIHVFYVSPKDESIYKTQLFPEM